MTRRRDISASEARRIALGAQGFDRARPAAAPDVRSMRRVMRTLGILQLDFVNVLIPAHYLVVYSRLGGYDLGRFQRLIYGRGDYTEQWAHEASIVPTDAWPLLGHRRRDYRAWSSSPIHKIRNKTKYLSEILEIIKEKGAITASDLPHVPGPKRKPGDWHRSVPRWALEHHFGRGALAVADRRPNFQRVYDLPERLIPAEHLDRRVDDADAQRSLLQRAAVASGVGTVRDLADYFRMSPREAQPRIRELVEEGALIEVGVDGWAETAYLARGARMPRRIDAAALLSPFDPVVWFRPRAERLFDFHYRIEIYVPEHKRRWGYYVLPFLLGEHLAARVDLKADRAAGRLLVRAAHLEEGASELETAHALAIELRRLADWLSLDRIAVSRRGSLARRLGKAVTTDACTRR